VHHLWRGPLGRLIDALPEARYEAVQALLRTSLCLISALTMLTVPSPTDVLAPAVANIAIGLGSLVVALLIAPVRDAEVARRYGRWSTAADLVILTAYYLAFHENPDAGGMYAVFVLLIGPLRYGLRGLPVTVLPVALLAIVLPQANPSGQVLSAAEVVLLCLGFTLPAVAVRAVLMRGSGRLRQVEQLLLHQAAHDPLTDLPNRNRALATLETALGEGEQVAVLFLDLDRFKVVNDGMGHAEGDRILVQVATRLRDVMRSGDLVARLGGDEFIVLCRDADGPIAERAATRVLHSLSTPMKTSGGLELVIGASVGIALGSTGDVADQLLADADSAMYAAKASGGGRSRIFTQDLRHALVRNHELEVDLRAAVRAGSLSLVYQPMVEFATGVITGCEALVRWRDDRWGVVGPDEFITVAEQSDLILELGEWVLRQALADAATWPVTQSGYAPSVSINVSLRQLGAAGFAERVAELVAESGVDPARICLELTETMLAGDVEPIIDVLKALRAQGLRLSIDDFGTGHASLTYLARFPVDQVKVDRSFVAGLGSDAGSAAIVGGVIAMSHTFDLRVVAEGVESELQLQLLRDLGCDAAQGFLLSVPIPNHQLGKLLLRRRISVAIPAPRSSLPASAQALEEVARHRLLVEGAKAVTSQRDLDGILTQALAALSATVRFTGAGLLVVEDDQLRIGAALPAPTQEALAGRIPLGQGVSGTIAVTGEPRYLPDITIASTVTANRKAHTSRGVRSWYGVPLISEGRAIGVLQLDSTDVDAFDQNDRLAVLSFAPVVAQALCNAQTHVVSQAAR